MSEEPIDVRAIREGMTIAFKRTGEDAEPILVKVLEVTEGPDGTFSLTTEPLGGEHWFGGDGYRLYSDPNTTA
jgi:hypothetical protein